MNTDLMIRELIVAFILIIFIKWGNDLLKWLHHENEDHEDIDAHLTGEVEDDATNELLSAYNDTYDELSRLMRYN